MRTSPLPEPQGPTIHSRRSAIVSVAGSALAPPVLAHAGLDDPRSGARAVHVIIIRHAEKSGEPADDPPLTPGGLARAELLANMLEHARVRRIMATRTRRSRETVAPLARRLSLEPIPYEPADVEAIRSQTDALSHGESILICGHSNTVPQIVRAMGGAIADLSERGWLHDDAYDRCFIVPRRAGPTPDASTLEIRLPMG